MTQYFRFLSMIGLPFVIFANDIHAGSPPSSNSFSFILQSDVDCESGYAADDASTLLTEEVCASFDLTGLEASAFQAGVAIGEVGDTGKIRPFWPLVSIEFNTDPRPLPNPAVSPLIFFRFLRDELCPSGYEGELLYQVNAQRGCLMFNLDGFRGSAIRDAKFLGDSSLEWKILDIVFENQTQESRR